MTVKDWRNKWKAVRINFPTGGMKMFGGVKTVSITSHLTEFAAMLKASGWQILGTKTMLV